MAVTQKVDMDGKPRVVIMNVAMHLFGKQGFNGTSMRDIANAVGLLPGSLYAHIESKEALLLEIVADGIGRFLAAVEPYVASSVSPLDRLRQMIIAHVEVVADNPERSQVVFHQWRFLSPEYIPEAIERRRRYETCFVEVIEEGVKAGLIRSDLNHRIAVLSILGAMNWTPEWFSPDGRLGAAQVGDLMADTLLGGILS
ncbi:TetR/AcrR family transcriptional regulator [Sphingorhabdus sp.]|uniref:TetR/AcrR family transcriptional regulator n=1 Tax=Sphingorhabdus sp. TaxID=1902408 RepID=UPI00260422B6|nr:TetR/AcrR family transcriptional regulator [Sphingorhabdus sp.]MDH4399820.1 TetR/AcrR family transcriptional regulator [Sphingorhabdus sp.]